MAAALRRRHQPAARLPDPGAGDVEGQPAPFELVSAALIAHGAAAVAGRAEGKDRSDDRAAGAAGQVKTVVDDAGLRMELKNALLFDSGQADITQRRPRRDRSRRQAAAHHRLAATRSRSRGTPTTSPSTRRASTPTGICRRRARSTCSSCSRPPGISPQRLSAQGYADTRPATAVNRRRDAPQARARSENRRVVIRVH